MYGPRHFAKMRPITQFFLDAGAGTLPNVYFVDPSFLGEHRTDDHPGGSDMNPAQAFVNNVVHAVTHGPQWPRQALFVNYDEWGGFWDHVPPPVLPDSQDDPSWSRFRPPALRPADDFTNGFGQLGMRVVSVERVGLGGALGAHGHVVSCTL